jgi:hypothetical protein
MQGNNDTEGPAMAYEPQIGETVTALGFNSGNPRTGAFKCHVNGNISAIIQPGGARNFVRRETIQPAEESK